MSFSMLKEANASTNSIFAFADEFDETTGDAFTGSSKYRHGHPLYEGKTTACFDDGLLFRVEEPNSNRWSFYNDTTNCQMEVEVTFGKESKIRALDNTVMKTLPDGSFKCTVTVYPLETELFIEGKPGSYKSNILPEKLSDDYLKDVYLQNREVIKTESNILFKLVGENASIDQTLKACIQSRVKFVDFEFPPEQESLQLGSFAQMKIVPWERPCMYLSDENARHARLFRNGIHPSNIERSDLGDSWFVGALSCFAEFPDMVRDRFRHPISLEDGKKEREIGAYRVTFNKNGWWTNVVIDDYLPCAGGAPKFARSKRDPLELWISVVEKAYAKMHGGYGFIVAGDPMHALQDLTGCPCASFDNAFMEAKHTGGSELFDHLLRYNSLGYQLVLVTPTREVLSSGPYNLNEESYNNTGLFLGHVYGVLKVACFPQHNIRLLHLRNPWSSVGTPVWKGMWKKGDPKWSQYRDVREACNYTETDDGTFYLEWSEALIFFSNCGVCFVQHPVYDFRIRGCFVHSVPTTCLEISVSTPVMLCLLLSQDDRRGTTKREYSPIMISIAHGGGCMSPMRVDLNSGIDTDHPNPGYTFFASREASMFYEFLPECSPYLVVPRAMSTYVELPYVLGLFSPVPVGTPTSTVRVAFRSLAPGCRVFDNLRNFDASTVPSQAEFQACAPNQFFPDIYSGTIIQVD